MHNYKIRTLTPRPWKFAMGGLEVQMQKTTQFLNEIEGIEAKYFNFQAVEDDFNFVHLFSCDYSFATIARQVRKAGVKLAVSSVYFTEYPLLMEFWTKSIDKIIWRSYFKLKKSVMDYADVVLPNCHAEMVQMHNIFSIPFEKMRVIPNGVDVDFKYATKDIFVQKHGWDDFVLCVSRIDPRKNIHLLIDAILQTDLRLVIIGPLDYSNYEYGKSIIDRINHFPEQIKYLGPIDHESEVLKSAYAAAHIHALPSKLETPGLCNLEAGLAGAKIVVSNLPTIREYLEDYPMYCTPNSVKSIKSALLSAYSSSHNDQLSNHIERNFTWSVVAEKTAIAYKELA